ncbi:MAG: LysM peptidoglycan-binding domain-containing protein [Hydrogenothermaceae bacterium]|nr:LysM peptidoglycan-binding domain-containing protein [Hydrogenothermaceae bacterium]
MNLKLSIKTALFWVLVTYSFGFAESYTIQKGDTIQKISQKFKVSEEEIIKANNIKDPKKLREGQKIKIPTTKVLESKNLKERSYKKGSREEIYEVRHGDTLEKIAKKYGIPVKEIMEYNDMRDEKIFAGDQLKIPPSSQVLKRKRGESNKRVDFSKCEVYTLSRGGTLKHVSKKTGVDVKTLERLNNVDSNVWLEAGARVCLGERKEQDIEKQNCELFYKPKERVSLSEVSRQFNIPKEKIKQLNNLSRDYIDKNQTVCLRTPEDMPKKSIQTDTNYTYYKVNRGDTLEKIAEKFGTSKSILEELNNLKNNKLIAGQSIKIPVTDSEVKRQVEEEPKEKRQPEQTAKVTLPREVKPKVEEIIPSTNGIKLGWPVRGSIVANFQNDDNARHLGVDISSLCSDRVLAADSGKVIYAGDSIKAFGNLVVIRHDNGLTTVYGYLDKISVSEGVRVSKGDEIGRAGKLKNSDSCGIYFEVRKNVTPIDPLKVLE